MDRFRLIAPNPIGAAVPMHIGTVFLRLNSANPMRVGPDFP